MLALDPPSDTLLPPIVRPFRHLQLQAGRGGNGTGSGKVDEAGGDSVTAFHIGCVQWGQQAEEHAGA